MTSRRHFALLSLCFLLSGMAALIYETVWTEQFALVFGASELAVAAVLGAYMAGLAAGAAGARRLVNQVRSPIRIYAAIELVIALAALAVGPALGWASRIQVAVLGGFDVPPEAGSLSSAIFYLAAAFVILLIPTALMGATLPLLVRFSVQHDVDLGPRVGWLYAVNTLGAAAGTLVAAFVLLPRLGLLQTVWVAVAVNATAFLGAALLSRWTAGETEDPSRPPLLEHAAEAAQRVADASTTWILPVMLVSGFVSFTWEVLWTRLLSHLLGGSVYAFGTMLATFLIGIALGAGLASRLATDRARARRGFIVAQIGVAAGSWGAYMGLDLLPALTDGAAANGNFLLESSLLAALTLLPGALFIGATFPFAVRLLSRGGGDAGPATARVFAWSTVGAIFGAILTGFVLLPALKFAGTASLALGTSLSLALVTALAPGRRLPRWALGCAVSLVVVVLVPRPTPWNVLRSGPLSGQPAAGEVAFYEVGRSATVMLIDERGTWRLSTNGLPEAMIRPTGSRVAGFTPVRWMALLPQLSRPETKSMMVVGLGAGMILESLPTDLTQVDVVELEPEVVSANRAMASVRRDPLSDPRVAIHLNDARSALTLSNRRYDAIVSQPSHPWTAGSSHLFTREFFSLVSQRLAPRGVFVQWIGLSYVDELLMRSLVATLNEVFAYVEVYHPSPGGSLLFLCGAAPLSDPTEAARGLAKSQALWRDMGIWNLRDVLLDRALSNEQSRQFGANAPLNTDSHNLLKTRSPRILDAPLGTRGFQHATAIFDPLASLSAEAGGLSVVRQLIRRGDLPRASSVASGLRDPAQQRVGLALTLLASGERQRGERVLWQSLERESSVDSEALHALVKLYRQDLSTTEGPPRLVRLLASDAEAKVVIEGWRRARQEQPLAIRDLEAELSAIEPDHGLFQAATQLRIAWRQASGEPARALEALDLLDPLLAHGARRPALLRRARLALAAQDQDRTFASLAELVDGIETWAESTPIRGSSLAILEEMPVSWRGPRFEQLVARLAPSH